MSRWSQPLLALLLLCTSTIVNATNEAYWEYTFRPGDNIWNIAKKYTTSVNNWAAIQKLNGIGEDRRIRPGSRIKIPVSMLKVQPAQASIIDFSGEVTVTHKNGTRAAVTLATKLHSGDEIKTGNNATVRIRFANGSNMLLLANSLATMDTLSAHGETGMVDTRVRLKSGQLEIKVKPLETDDSRYQIITPAAVAAVRGTAFRIAADTSLMRSEVTEGNVEIATNQQAKSLNAGFGLVAEKDKPLPEPVKLLAAPALSDSYQLTQYPQTINWQALPGANAYRVQLAKTDAFNSLIVDRISKTNHTEFIELQNGQYALRVRGIDAQQLQGLNANATVHVNAYPTAPLVTATTSDKRIHLNWKNQHNTTELQIARDAQFTDVLVASTSTDSHLQTQPLAEGSYYYRARSIDNRGVKGKFGDTGTIHIEDTLVWPYSIGIAVLFLLL